MNKNNLVWFRNDLRSSDHHGLAEACSNAQQHGGKVVALYCLDPRQFEKDRYGFRRTEKFRAQFLLESLADLQRQLAVINVPLLISQKHPESAIPALVATLGISDLYLQREWTRDERQVQEAVQSAAGMAAVNLHEFYGQLLLHPQDLPFAPQDLPRVFTAFRKSCEQAWSVRPPVPRPSPMPAENGQLAAVEGFHTSLPSLAQLGLETFTPDPRSAFPFHGGGAAAQQRIQDYFWKSENLLRYKHTRDGLVGTDYSSKLSPWLANGSLSPRQVYWLIREFEQDVKANEDTYWLVFELLWRDFFKFVSLKHGDQIFRLGGILEQEYTWQRDPQEIQCWINGETEYDFVNANMREIAATGWMSNRGRQNVASYFARERQQDWRIGAAYFESLLLDYDVHSNYGNWMYNSGVGNDPRDRRFDIQGQAERYDPDRSFRNRWR
ncbi:DASH family cryptochrome [Microbulbifer sp. CAU 1566]|uniref:DASH family cryptochrome n=1 Tax=Microbulbifer sp. CAU 1566 TaxID=2933269 RepID=UPI002005AB21|nr:DASH family cryptochrome [Microbulbifer sp. CAU 1566]MCK7596449.1 DASH family cryptochrome [Microbulbifer sp. CAU 1566]